MVDDGSRDRAALSRALARRPATRLVRAPGRGPATARNLGARASSGEVVCFTDDDCVPEPGWAAALAEAASAAGSAAGRTLAPAAARAPVLASQAIVEHLTLASLDPAGDRLGFAPTCNLAVGREALGSLPFDESFPRAAGEDRDWSDRATAAGLAPVYAPAAVVVHHQRLGAARLRPPAVRLRPRGGPLSRRRPRPRLAGPGFYAASGATRVRGRGRGRRAGARRAGVDRGGHGRREVGGAGWKGRLTGPIRRSAEGLPTLPTHIGRFRGLPPKEVRTRSNPLPTQPYPPSSATAPRVGRFASAPVISHTVAATSTSRGACPASRSACADAPGTTSAQASPGVWLPERPEPLPCRRTSPNRGERSEARLVAGRSVQRTTRSGSRSRALARVELAGADDGRHGRRPVGVGERRAGRRRSPSAARRPRRRRRSRRARGRGG